MNAKAPNFVVIQEAKQVELDRKEKVHGTHLSR